MQRYPFLNLLCVQLLDTNAVGVRREKMYKLDDHVACAVAGMTGARAVVLQQAAS